MCDKLLSKMLRLLFIFLWTHKFLSIFQSWFESRYKWRLALNSMDTKKNHIKELFILAPNFPKRNLTKWILTMPLVKPEIKIKEFLISLELGTNRLYVYYSAGLISILSTKNSTELKKWCSVRALNEFYLICT